jgi:hypothetical protein
MMPRRAGKTLLGGLVLATVLGQAGFGQSHNGVSLSFDHVVRPAASRKDSEIGLLWLRLKNNSGAPIRVLAGAAQDGAEGVEVVHEIVEDSGSGKPASGWIAPPSRYSPVNAATTVEIQPKSDLLFSVPLNHVGPSWRLQITFESVRPQARRQESTVDFTWAGVPAKERDAWKVDDGK